MATNNYCSSALALFYKPSNEVGMDNYFITEVLPTHPLSNASTQIVFDVPVSEEYTDLDSTMLSLRVKIKNSDNSNLADFVAPEVEVLGPPVVVNPANSVGFINLTLNSLFSGVDVKLNHVAVNSNFYTNQFIAYFQTILSYSPSTLDSKLALSGWYTENNLGSNRGDDGTPDKTEGFYRRAQKTKRSREWTLLGSLHNPVTMQPRFLPPLLPISFVLTKSKPEFVLHTNVAGVASFKYEILSAKLLIKRQRILSSTKLRLESDLAKTSAIYPLRNFDCKPLTLDPATKSFTFENVFSSNSSIPDYCLIALLRHTDFSGDYKSNPFTFSHFSVEEISITFDQYRFVHETNYVDADREDYTGSYNALFSHTGFKSDQGTSITIEKYKTGFALYAFDFGRDNSMNCDHWNTKVTGSARLSFRFNAASNNPALVALVYSESNNILQINSQREVIRAFNI